MIPPKDESEARAKALANARDLVDKLREQSDELAADPRFGQGADLARSAKAAAEELLRQLSIPTPEIPHE